MTRLVTLGSEKRQTEFKYSGSVSTGVDVLFKTARVHVDQSFFARALRRFSGQSVKGGFNMDDPPQGGFGAWVQRESQSGHNSQKLTPRHASFVAAILCHEAGVTSWLEGAAVWLRFPAEKGG